MDGKKRKLKQDYKDMRRIMSEVEATVLKNYQGNKEPKNANPKDDEGNYFIFLILLLFTHPDTSRLIPETSQADQTTHRSQ